MDKSFGVYHSRNPWSRSPQYTVQLALQDARCVVATTKAQKVELFPDGFLKKKQNIEGDGLLTSDGLLLFDEFNEVTKWSIYFLIELNNIKDVKHKSINLYEIFSQTTQQKFH